jgi:BlaI family penicillinase repressor
MATTPLDKLSRREREVIQILYSMGDATAIDIQGKLAPGTKNAATRKILTALLTKGVIKRHRVGRQYIYTPTNASDDVGTSALKQVLHTFFNGSLAHGLLGMVELEKERFTEDELAQIREIVKDKD